MLYKKYKDNPDFSFNKMNEKLWGKTFPGFAKKRNGNVKKKYYFDLKEAFDGFTWG